mmetsp:Transcript_45895/g.85335  ORF Transcript_45895/g.85335 Transcript_45895/m.85335 type:complete len:97 (-) Transcript_45895:860-1150(-)
MLPPGLSTLLAKISFRHGDRKGLASRPKKKSALFQAANELRWRSNQPSDVITLRNVAQASSRPRRDILFPTAVLAPSDLGTVKCMSVGAEEGTSLG